MGFFSDLGKGLGSVIKAPFEAVGGLVRDVGAGIGSIVHGSGNQQTQPQEYAGQCAQQCQGQDPQRAMMMLQFQNALLTNMLLSGGGYPRQMRCCG
jgi:hypothetical protein